MVFLYSFEIYYIDSSKNIGDPPKIYNFNHLFFNFNRFICNNLLLILSIAVVIRD